MTGFVICCDFLILSGHDLAALFSTDTDLDESLADIILNNIWSSAAGSINGCLVQQVFKIRPGKSRRRLGYLIQVNVVAERFVLGMNSKNLPASSDVRHSHRDLPVEASRSQDCRVQNIHTVGRCENNNSLICPKTVHLYQKLIQRLFTLVVASAETGAAASGDCVDLIDEHDAGMIILGVREQVAYTRSADTDEHFHEIGTRNREERNTCLAGNSLGNQRFTCSGRSDKQYTLGYSCSESRILRRIPQEIHKFLEILLLLLKACYVIKCDRLLIGSGHSRPALSEIHHLRVRPAALSVHQNKEEHENAGGRDDQEHRVHHRIISRNIVDRNFDTVVLRGILLDFPDVRHIHPMNLIFLHSDYDLTRRSLRVRPDRDRYDIPLLERFRKLFICK